MAPIEVADYVVAHEVAHLAQMNHGPRFWQVCGSISASPPDLSIAWLKANGQRLRRCL
jgi:predicted metal-dependent hydrolase